MEKDERAVHVERMGEKKMLTVILGDAEVQKPHRNTRHRWEDDINVNLNPLNAELNPVCYLLALLTHHFLHVSRIRVKLLTLRLLVSYIYGTPILDVSRSHTTTHHSR